MLQKGQNTALLNACVGTSNVEIMVSIFVVALSPCANTFYRKDRIQLY
jgi:hypothetical protein